MGPSPRPLYYSGTLPAIVLQCYPHLPTVGPPDSAFFLPVKIKSTRASQVRPFSEFFHGGKSGFHAHFLLHFHGQSKVFTDAFLDFFSGGFLFSLEGNSEFLIFFRNTTFFHGYKKKINFTKFHCKSKLYFSPTHFSIFTYVI